MNKRLYVLDEDNPNSFDDRKPSSFVKFKQMSQTNISNLIQGKNKFYEYDDFEK